LLGSPEQGTYVTMNRRCSRERIANLSQPPAAPAAGNASKRMVASEPPGSAVYGCKEGHWWRYTSKQAKYEWVPLEEVPDEQSSQFFHGLHPAAYARRIWEGWPVGEPTAGPSQAASSSESDLQATAPAKPAQQATPEPAAGPASAAAGPAQAKEEPVAAVGLAQAQEEPVAAAGPVQAKEEPVALGPRQEALKSFDNLDVPKPLAAALRWWAYQGDEFKQEPETTSTT
jgi:hypothetical protein